MSWGWRDSIQPRSVFSPWLPGVFNVVSSMCTFDLKCCLRHGQTVGDNVQACHGVSSLH